MLKKGDEEYDWSDDDFPDGSEIPEDEMNTHVDDATGGYFKDNEKSVKSIKDDRQPPPKIKKELENPDKERRTRQMFDRMGVPTVKMKSIIDELLNKASFFGQRQGQNVVQESEVERLPSNKMRGMEARSVVGHKEYSYNPRGTITATGPGGRREIPANKQYERELKEASMNTVIDELLNKARSYPKVESYLRGIDKQRIDEGKDVPVTKREKAVRQADENAAKRLEAQGKSSESDLEKAVQGRPEHERDMERLAEAEYRFRQNNPEDVTKPDSLDSNFDKENIMAAKSFDDETAEYFVKCHSHVLFGETEDELESKKKEAPKAKDHVFGNDPNDKRGSELEMVKKKEPDAYKSEESDLVKSIDALVEKAIIGYHARGGKFETGTHKSPKKHGEVSSPSLSEERKKELLANVSKKAGSRAGIEGLHKRASEEDKIAAESQKHFESRTKSLDERTCDLAKSLYDIVNRKKFSRQDPDAGINKEKERKMDADEAKDRKTGIRENAEAGPRYEDLDRSSTSDLEKGGLVRGGGKVEMPEGKRKLNEDITKLEMKEGKKTKLSEGSPGKHAVVLGMKSLDERTIDLVKALTRDREKEIHDAVSTARMIKHGVEGAEKMKIKPEDLHRVVRTHNNIAAARTQKSICEKWQIESPFITKGARVMPIGPGGEVQDLSKDEDEDNDVYGKSKDNNPKKKDDMTESDVGPVKDYADREEKRQLRYGGGGKHQDKSDHESWGDYFKRM